MIKICVIWVSELFSIPCTHTIKCLFSDFTGADCWEISFEDILRKLQYPKIYSSQCEVFKIVSA